METKQIKVCSTPGCNGEPDQYNIRCDSCFEWYRQENRVKDYHYQNKMVAKFKDLDESSLEIDGIDFRDYPDFVDVYISSAYWNDGTPLSDQDLDSLTDWYRFTGGMYELIRDGMPYD